jgi:hypothetical protein
VNKNDVRCPGHQLSLAERFGSQRYHDIGARERLLCRRCHHFGRGPYSRGPRGGTGGNRDALPPKLWQAPREISLKTTFGIFSLTLRFWSLGHVAFADSTSALAHRCTSLGWQQGPLLAPKRKPAWAGKYWLGPSPNALCERSGERKHCVQNILDVQRAPRRRGGRHPL